MNSIELVKHLRKAYLPFAAIIYLILLFFLFLMSFTPVYAAEPGWSPHNDVVEGQQTREEDEHPVIIEAENQITESPLTETQTAEAQLIEAQLNKDEGQQEVEKDLDQARPDISVPVETTSDEYGDVTEEEEKSSEGPVVADPLEPWNRGMYYFNDKLYFWLLKPVATGYKYVLPEDIRGLFSNFYRNIKAPVRIVNNLLQGKPGYAGIELVKLLINSTIGVGGLRDCATECFGIKGRDADFGQTLGTYGIGHGFYLVWPFIGPSSARDSVGWGIDWTLKPTTYTGGSEWINYANFGISAHEVINRTSFHIGDYESLKDAAIDPYISMRDIYIQYRKKMVDQ